MPKKEESPGDIDIQTLLKEITELKDTQKKLMEALLSSKKELDETKEAVAKTRDELPRVVVEILKPVAQELNKSVDTRFQKYMETQQGDPTGEPGNAAAQAAPQNMSIGQAIVWGIKYIVDNGDNVAKAADSLRSVFKPGPTVSVEREVADRLMMTLKMSRLLKQFGDTNLQIDEAAKVIDETLGVKR